MRAWVTPCIFFVRHDVEKKEKEAAELRQRLEMQAGSAFSTTKPCGFHACISPTEHAPRYLVRSSQDGVQNVKCGVRSTRATPGHPRVRLGRGQVGP